MDLPAKRPKTNDRLDVVLMTENPAKLQHVVEALRDRGLSARAIDIRVCPPSSYPAHVYVNLARPCAHTRDDPRALPDAVAALDRLERGGARVVNGTKALKLEVAKSNQFRIMRQLDLRFPAAMVFRSKEALQYRSASIPFPAVLRKNACSSVACMFRVNSYQDICRVLDEHPELSDTPEAREAGMILQQCIPEDLARRGIVRLEFVGGELLYAIRVRGQDRCYSCACEDDMPSSLPMLPVGFLQPHSEHYKDVPEDAIDVARTLMQHVGLDLASIEYVEDENSMPIFCDVRIMSYLRFPSGLDLDVKPMDCVVDYLMQEVHIARCMQEEREAASM